MDKFSAIIIGGIAAFGLFLAAAILAAFMHDAKAEDSHNQVFPPAMGDRMLLLAAPGVEPTKTQTGDL